LREYELKLARALSIPILEEPIHLLENKKKNDRNIMVKSLFSWRIFIELESLNVG